MWLLIGPFDGEVGRETSFQKTKLLKTNKSYALGRKDRPLVIASKKISHDHCDIVVGDYTIDDVGNLSAKPSLHIMNRNKKDKTIGITRGSQVVYAQPSTTQDIEDGDIVSLVSGITLIVQWMPVCVYSSRKSSVSLEACASLGIKLIHKPDAEVTHHLTNSYLANLSIATSLLSLCKLVQPEWLNEFIRLGTTPLNGGSGEASLEAHFDFPLISKFRPTFSPSLPPSQKSFSKWEPNEERVNLLHKFRFICMTEKSREVDSELRDVIHRGGGTLEIFDIHSDISKFHQALTRSRAKEGKSVVIIGDVDAMQTAVGSAAWEELLGEARSFGLNILPTAALIQAILDVDTCIFSEPIPMGIEKDADSPLVMSPLLDVVPTLSERSAVEPTTEFSQASKPPGRLTRRVTSQPPADLEPSAPTKSPEPEPETLQPRPRRALTRRVVEGKPVVAGLDDPSAILKSIPDFPERKTPPPSLLDITAPTPARSSRLKRRVGVAGLDVQSGSESQAYSLGIEDTITEPPLKKFKALFDASNPERMDIESLALMDSMLIASSTQTQTQSETQTRGGRTLRSGKEGPALTVLQEEEEEESQIGDNNFNRIATRTSKRRLDSVNENSETDVAGHEASGNAFSANKKRAVENVNAVESCDGLLKPLSTRAASKPPFAIPAKTDKQGAAPGKPDTDAAFLKAIASTKRGKKAEDKFDREFNNLKISKPELEQEEPEEEWAVLADFGDDTGLRGNFMVVVELDVYKKDKDPQQNSAVNHGWIGKPNFKKFKKKVIDSSRSRVELFLNDENVYGMGSSHRKGDKQLRSDNVLGNTSQMDSQIQTSTQPKGRKRTATKPLSESDDDSAIAPVCASRDNPPSRFGSVLPQKRTAARAGKVMKKKPLFLDSDDEGKHDEDNTMDVDPTGGGVDEEQTLQSSFETSQTVNRRSTRETKSRKPAPIVVDDDSDDDAVFKGFKGQKKGR
ncbi:proline-rich protein [Phlegmacium glaucopus]|nr:proline-rich protein [Phlegmacium glaucopus]